MNEFFLKDNTNFTPYTIQHVLVLLFFTLAGIILIKWAKKQSLKTQISTGNILAYSISIAVIIDTLLRISTGHFDYKEDLPLHLCSFMA